MNEVKKNWIAANVNWRITAIKNMYSRRLAASTLQGAMSLRPLSLRPSLSSGRA